MKKHYLILFVVSLCVSCTGDKTSQTEKQPISIMFDDAALADAKNAWRNGDETFRAAFLEFREYVDAEFLGMEPLSVTDKEKTAPSNDPRDYITLSPYWWPDPGKAGGLPYIRRDGERNPEVYDYPERANSGILGDAVQALALVYFITDEKRYAEKAAELLKAWFTDPRTDINPNMTYAQIIPGHTNLRGTGIIDSRRFIVALNGAKMIENSVAWTATDKRELTRWTETFIYWLENSTQGHKENNAVNNHALWYETIRLICVMYTENHEYTRFLLENSFAPRLDYQIAEDGSLPAELARTLGLHYSTFVMEAASLSAIMGMKVGFDLWNHTTVNGRNLAQALEYLYPYYMDNDAWPHMQIQPFESERSAIVLYEAGKYLAQKPYLDAAARMGYRGSPRDINNIIYYHLLKQPITEKSNEN